MASKCFRCGSLLSADGRCARCERARAPQADDAAVQTDGSTQIVEGITRASAPNPLRDRNSFPVPGGRPSVSGAGRAPLRPAAPSLAENRAHTGTQEVDASMVLDDDDAGISPSDWEEPPTSPAEAIYRHPGLVPKGPHQAEIRQTYERSGQSAGARPTVSSPPVRSPPVSRSTVAAPAPSSTDASLERLFAESLESEYENQEPPPASASVGDPRASSTLADEAMDLGRPSQSNLSAKTFDGDDEADVGEDGAVSVTLAPLWRRLLATTIDGAILGGVFYFLFFIASSFTAPSERMDGFTGLDAFAVRTTSLGYWLVLILLLGFGVAIAYTTFFAMKLEGRSLGRKIAGVQLVDGSGHPLSPTRAATRAVLSVASFLICCAGFWLALVDRRGQTLHDKLTRSFLIVPEEG